MEKLYYTQPYAMEFEGRVESCREGKKKLYEIILNQSAFFPEGGGQPFDTGKLAQVEVLEVHERDGEVVHYTSGPLEEGSVVRGTIDWQRRYDNMQQHSGEHILTGLIHNRFGLDNVGFHMGSEEVTIDFNGAFSMEALEELELLANQVIYDNVPFQVTCPSPGELESLEYRSKKELTGEVRIVSIPGVDACACCGTHVRSSGEVGLIKVLGMVNYKGGVRISMLSGRPALLNYRKRQRQVSSLSALLSVKQDAVCEAVEKIKTESAGKDAELNGLYQELFEIKTEQYSEGRRPLVVFEKQLTPVLLRRYCTMLYERNKGNIVLVLSGEEGNYQYAMGSLSEDMRALSKELNGRLNGRGGGSSLMAQGSFLASEEQIRLAMTEL